MSRFNRSEIASLKGTVRLIPRDDRAMGFDVMVEQPAQATALARAAGRSTDSELTLLQKAFQPGTASSYNMAVRICAEGDSWCNLLWPVSGYPKTLVDWLGEKYYTNNIGWPGDTMAEMLEAKQYHQPIKSGSFDFFIFSGGGVDFFTDLGDYLVKYDASNPQANPADYTKPAFKAYMKTITTRYKAIARQVTTWTTRTKLVLHGYDYAIPVPSGRFLGQRFEKLGYDTSGPLPRRLVKYLIDEYYLALEAAVATAPQRIILVNCRGACQGKWHDELHGTSAATKEVARRFAKAMNVAF